jgi:hypothetical protein
MGRFSIDRTVRDYASKVWGINATSPPVKARTDIRKDS